MNSLKKHLPALGAVVLTVTIAATAAHYKATLHEQQQIAFITSYYKNYIDSREFRRKGSGHAKNFYSTSVESLLAINKDRCDSPSRNDEICGYEASGDALLNTHETDPDLTFEKTGFKALRSGPNTIDVSFNVFPEHGSYYDKRMKYILVRDPSGWRVNDVYFGYEGKFLAEDSLRAQVTRENDGTLMRNRDLTDAADKVLSYLSHDDGDHYVEERMVFPILICNHLNDCRYVSQCDPKFRHALLELRLEYYGSRQSIVDFLYAPDKTALSKGGQVLAEEDKVVAIDALDFTFRKNAWLITAIDLRRLGTTIRKQKLPERSPINAQP